jgi:hypothetical protein
MAAIGFIVLAIWLLLSGLRSVANIGTLGNATLLSVLQIVAGVLILFGQFVILR